MSSKYSYLKKNVLLFSIMGFVPRLPTFFLIPVYTKVLTTAEYGLADLINTTVLFLLPIFTVDVQDAVMRFAMDKERKLDEVFTTAIRVILTGGFLILIITCTAYKVNLFAVQGSCYVLFFITYIVTAFYNIISLFCRAIDKVNCIVVGSIINTIVTTLANILFLLVFEWGLIGFLFANFLGLLSSAVYVVHKAQLYQYIKMKMPFFVDKEMLEYSLPLAFSVIAWWINSASSRYILTWMAGVSVSGVFAVAFKIPNILSIFQNIFAQAWSISAIKEFDKNDSDGFISNIYAIMNGGMCILCSFIMIANIYIAKLLYSNDFFQAWEYVPPLLIAVVFNAMALFIGSIFTAVKDTSTLSFSTIGGAIIITICNLIFIKYWSAYGAVVASVLGYGATLAMRHYFLRRYIILKIQWSRDFGVYSLLMLQMIIATYGLRYIWLQILVLLAVMHMHKKEIGKIYGVVVRKLGL